MAPEDTSRTSASAPSDDAALRAITEGVESETGDKFFSSLARSLALALGVRYAFVSRLSDDGTQFKNLALWERDPFGQSIELPMTGTPCECVLRGEVAHNPERLQTRFPDDGLLFQWGAQSYRGVPVLDTEGRVFGHLAILDDKPMTDEFFVNRPFRQQSAGRRSPAWTCDRQNLDVAVTKVRFSSWIFAPRVPRRLSVHQQRPRQNERHLAQPIADSE